MQRAVFKLLSEGPLRSVFQLLFEGMAVGENVYDINHQISIVAGKPYYTAEVTISCITGTEKLVTGIVNMQSDTFKLIDYGERSSLSTYGQPGFFGRKTGHGTNF
ncbi:MAG: DUF4861 domain-containing protein [Bacteroidales bacterium]|nr:DUF4861 domain-containing protein [Bacteroidales bacterium]